MLSSNPLAVVDTPDISQDYLGLYQQMLLPRVIEEQMLIELRQGNLTKWFSGIGQEAISVGVASALDPDDYVLTAHRNLGVFTARGVPLERLFMQILGKAEGFTSGRDRSFHFSLLDYRIVGMISHLGAQLPVAAGIALSQRLKGEKHVTAVFMGDGATSQGDFHEALNLAAVWKLPVIFIVENNGYALSTPTSEQYSCAQIVDRAQGYGIRGEVVDGNDILAVRQAVTMAAYSMRENPCPVLLEFLTFRMRGHEEASGTRYVPQELIESWTAKDPLKRFEKVIIETGLYDSTQLEAEQSEFVEQVKSAFQSALVAENPTPDPARETRAVFSSPRPNPVASTLHQNTAKELRFVDAISQGLDLALAKHPNLVLMGQDIAEYGGVFKVTKGLLEKYGESRIRNTPLMESGVLGAGLGLSIAGHKSIIEMQFSDFATCGFNQIVNNIAKTHYRWGHSPDIVIRMPCGAGSRGGPFHSQTNEAWFVKTPGLKIVYPSNPEDAKGLLLAAIEDPNPVLYFEHKLLYRKAKGLVPEEYYTTPIGAAQLVHTGEDATVVTYGLGVVWALAWQRKHGSQHNIDIIDLRTLAPFDLESVYASVRKTSRVLVLHEDSLTCGVGAEIAAQIAEHCFEFLDAPVLRVGSLDTPVPFAAELEDTYLPARRFDTALERLLSY